MIYELGVAYGRGESALEGQSEDRTRLSLEFGPNHLVTTMFMNILMIYLVLLFEHFKGLAFGFRVNRCEL